MSNSNAIEKIPRMIESLEGDTRIEKGDAKRSSVKDEEKAYFIPRKSLDVPKIPMVDDKPSQILIKPDIKTENVDLYKKPSKSFSSSRSPLKSGPRPHKRRAENDSLGEGRRRRPELPPSRPRMERGPLCTILLLGTRQRRYADHIKDLLLQRRLSTEIRFPDNQPLRQVMDEIAREGSSYIMIIGRENEAKRNVALRFVEDPEAVKAVPIPLEDIVHVISDRERKFHRRPRSPERHPPMPYGHHHRFRDERIRPHRDHFARDRPKVSSPDVIDPYAEDPPRRHADDERNLPEIPDVGQITSLLNFVERNTSLLDPSKRS